MAKRLLESHFDFIWIEGELSNLAQPGSGHWYFSLKDDSAQVRCAMFRNRNQRVKMPLANGKQVLVRARVSLYEGRGEFQLIVEHMEDAGAGALQRAFEVLKQKLSDEGLFDPQRKRKLPELPTRLAIITSPTGAAVRDILTVLGRRPPSIEVCILPVAVQGEEAAPGIVRALAIAQKDGNFDAIVLARGGGSMEDLWAFNEEVVARAIAASSITVISAVGHETDFTIADFVADARAPTPSAAAEMLSPDRRELLLNLQASETKLLRALSARLNLAAAELASLRRALRHPGERLREQAQRIDHFELRLRRGIQQQLAERRHLRAVNNSHLRRLSPGPRLQHLHLSLAHLIKRYRRASRSQLELSGQRLALLSGKLHSLSPLATLQRGYAIVTDNKERVVTSAAAVQTGDRLTTRLAQGRIHSTVDACESD